MVMYSSLNLKEIFSSYVLKVLAGDLDPAIRTHAAFFSVWKRYGFTPEGFNLATLNVQVWKILDVYSNASISSIGY